MIDENLQRSRIFCKENIRISKIECSNFMWVMFCNSQRVVAAVLHAIFYQSYWLYKSMPHKSNKKAKNEKDYTTISCLLLVNGWLQRREVKEAMGRYS